MSRDVLRATYDEKRTKLSRHIAVVIEPLLERETYAELRVDAIIKASGVARSTFYVYFNDKVDLLAAMIESVLVDIRATGFWQSADDQDEEQLRAGLRRAIEAYREHRLLLRALVEGAGYDSKLREIHDGVIDQAVVNAVNHIRKGQRAGTIAPDLSPEGTGRLLIYAGASALYHLVGVEGREDDAAVLDPLVDIYWRALYEGYR